MDHYYFCYHTQLANADEEFRRNARSLTQTADGAFSIFWEIKQNTETSHTKPEYHRKQQRKQHQQKKQPVNLQQLRNYFS